MMTLGLFGFAVSALTLVIYGIYQVRNMGE